MLNRVNELFKDSGGCVLIEKDSTVYIGWLEACKIIDRQANDIDQYRDMLKARKEEIDRLQAELKGKDEALKIAREAMALASEMYFYEKKGIDKMLCEQGDIIDNILKGIKR